MSLTKTEITSIDFSNMLEEAGPEAVERTEYASFTLHEFKTSPNKGVLVVEGVNEDYVLLS